MKQQYGPALDNDSEVAYVFRCGDSDLYAVSLDRDGAGLPTEPCAHGWVRLHEFRLGVHEPLPMPIDPEPILRGLRDRGWYLWRNANTSKTHGTSQ